MVVLYTDGITEGENANGQALGREQFLAWARLRDNDETLLVLQREHEPLAVMLGGWPAAMRWANWERL